MQAGAAPDEGTLREGYPFSALKEAANVLIFPDLGAGDIAHELLDDPGGVTANGPIPLGMRRPVHVLEQGANLQATAAMAAAEIDAQERTPHQEPRDRSAAPPSQTIHSRL
jgi:malate dehydrogenase (oxaloacetate-decarboxylating)(NADP+)